MPVIAIVERGPDLATHFINLYQVARLRYPKAMIGIEMLKKTKQRERERERERDRERERGGGGELRNIAYR